MRNKTLARDADGFDILGVRQGSYKEPEDVDHNAVESWGNEAERISESIWSDFESENYVALLIRHKDLSEVTRDLESAGFDVQVSSDMIREAMPVAETVRFGDGYSGTVEIVRLSDSWVVFGD